MKAIGIGNNTAARAAIAACVLAVASTAGAASAWSGTFAVDTRDGAASAWSGYFTADTRDASSAPVVTAIRGKFFDDGKKAYFLPGLAVQERIEATVDWRGQAAGTVTFRKNGILILQNDSSRVLEYNVGAMAPLETITAQAVSADGSRVSASKTANFWIMPVPGVLSSLGSAASLLDTLDRGDWVEYKLKVGSSLNFFGSTFDNLPQSDQGKDIPGCTGQPLKWDVAVDLIGSLKSDGTIALTQRVGGGVREPWNLMGLRLGADVAFGLHGQYLGTQGWAYGGQGALGVNGSMKTPPLYVWHLPPVYSKAYVRARISAAGEITKHPSRDDLQWKISLPGEVLVGLIGGLGVDGAAAVEVFGGGGPYWDLQLAPDPSLEEYGITMEYGIRLIFLFFGQSFANQHYVDLKDLVEGSAQPQALAVLSVGGADEGLIRTLAAPQRDGGFRPLPRTGRASVLRTLDLGDPVPAALETALEASETLLQADVFPYSQPALVVTGGVPVVCWVRDNPARSDENRTELVAQGRAVGGAWSNVTPLWDDGTADFAPALSAVSNGLLLAWQNTGDVLPAGATLADTFAAQEIGAAFLSETGTATTNLTDNAWLDHSPKLSARGGRALLVWLENPANNPTGSAAEPSNLRYAVWEAGTWSAAGSVTNGLGTVLWITLGYNGNEGRVLACLDTDEDRATVADQELYGAVFNGVGWSPLARLTVNAVQDANPQLAVDAQGGFVQTWFQDGALLTASAADLADAVAAGGMEGTSAAADYRLLTGPNGELAAVWQSVGEAGQVDPAVLHYDRFQARWSEAARLLSNSNRMERSFAGAFGEDGTLHLAYDSVQVGADAEGRPLLGQVDLCALAYQPTVDLAIRDAMILLDPEAPSAGEPATVSVVVANLGTLAATNVLVAIYDGLPQAGGVAIGGTNLVAAALDGGATATVSVAWTVPYSVVSRTLVAVVDPGELVPDANRSNNSATRSVLQANLAVDAMHSQVAAGTERAVYARIANVGGVAVSNTVTVVFREGASTGAVIGACSVFPVEPGSQYEAALVWDAATVASTSAFTTVWATVDEQELIDDASRADNVGSTVVMTALDGDDDGLPDGQELQLGTAPGNEDSDGDGIKDGDEVLLHDTDPLLVDTDGDGMSDGDEVRAGTVPQDRESLLRILGVGANAAGGGGPVVLTFQSVAGKRYVVRRVAALGGEWETVGEPFEATGDTVEIPVGVAEGSAAAFYCIQLVE